jgi:Ca2+-binding EF-hand superfamily protein
LAEDEIEEMIKSLNPENPDCLSFEEFFKIMSKMNIQ